MAARRPADAHLRVFINCPFDTEYAPLLRAVAYTVRVCGYRPVCALEESDSGQIRFEKLERMVRGCDWGIHDLSRTGLDGATGLPRFNMPFELGFFLGAKAFGAKVHKAKRTLVLAHSRTTWAPAISDLAGIDPEFHEGQLAKAVTATRNFLKVTPAGDRLPGATAIVRRLEGFLKDLPDLARAADLTEPEALRYPDFMTFVEAALLAEG